MNAAILRPDLAPNRVRNLSSSRRRATILTLTAFLLTGPLALAGVTGSISGVVRDSTGSVIPGIQVVAQNTQTGVTVLTSTRLFFLLNPSDNWASLAAAFSMTQGSTTSTSISRRIRR
jgi:hypothetical protein